MLENEGGSEIVRFTEEIRKGFLPVRFRGIDEPSSWNNVFSDLNELTLCGIGSQVIVNITDDIRSEGIGLACKKI